MSQDGKNIQELEIPHTYVGSTIESLSYSLDEKQIAYEESYSHSFAPPAGTNSSFIYDFETKAIIPLNNISETCRSPKWSPSSKMILLSCDLSTDGITADPHVRILKLMEKGSITVSQVADFPQCVSPAWSPDGKQVVMVCQKEDDTGLFHLFLAKSDGSDYKEIKISGASIPTHFWEPVWSPDGTQIVYEGGTDTENESIFIINSDGPNNRPLTNQEASYSIVSVYPVP